jgi:hypothetical protein
MQKDKQKDKMVEAGRCDHLACGQSYPPRYKQHLRGKWSCASACSGILALFRGPAVVSCLIFRHGPAGFCELDESSRYLRSSPKVKVNIAPEHIAKAEPFVLTFA